MDRQAKVWMGIAVAIITIIIAIGIYGYLSGAWDAYR